MGGKAVHPISSVVVAQEGQRAAGIREVVEDLLIQAFVAQPAVEGLDVALLLRLAGVNLMPLDLVVVRPFQDGFADELGSVAHSEYGVR